MAKDRPVLRGLFQQFLDKFLPIILDKLIGSLVGSQPTAMDLSRKFTVADIRRAAKKIKE